MPNVLNVNDLFETSYEMRCRHSGAQTFTLKQISPECKNLGKSEFIWKMLTLAL